MGRFYKASSGRIRGKHRWISNIINGKTKNPGIDYLIAIAEALELSNDEFAELCGYKNDN